MPYLREDMDVQHLLDIYLSVCECPIDMDFINSIRSLDCEQTSHFGFSTYMIVLFHGLF